MSGNWTNGPWRADGEPWNRIVWSGAGNRVCFMAHSNGLNDDGDIATSNLIAAAPEMVPLVEAMASLPIGPNTADDVPLYGLDGVYITHGHVREARTVLAKARGEAP